MDAEGTSDDEDGPKKSAISASAAQSPANFDIEDGIYQAGDLVDKFRGILLRMNKGGADKSMSGETQKEIVFPFNELYKTSPFKEIYDWESIIIPEDTG